MLAKIERILALDSDDLLPETEITGNCYQFLTQTGYFSLSQDHREKQDQESII